PPTSTLYTLSLHDALPIYDADAEPGVHQMTHRRRIGDLEQRHRTEPRLFAGCDHSFAQAAARFGKDERAAADLAKSDRRSAGQRSEEHTSELQSRSDLVCR